MQELRNMPEQDLHSEFENLGLSLNTFRLNSFVLNKILGYGTNDTLSAIQLFSLHNLGALEKFSADITWSFHNYLASAASLIDHTRVFYQSHFANSDKFTEYQGKVDKLFATDQLSQFIKGLRNYCLHYKLPFLTHSLTFDIAVGNEPIAFVRLATDTLKKWGSWNSTAKKYLETSSEFVDLKKITNDYGNKVNDFYSWFEARVRDIYKKEFEKLRSKEDEYFQLELEDRLDNPIFIPGLESNPDDLFVNIFTGNDFEELSRVPLYSDEHTKHAVRILKRHISVSSSLEQKIINFYKDYLLRKNI